MHGTIAEGAPAPVVAKRRTITLTNRAPISIIEDNWPVIAQGGCGEDVPDGAPWPDWKIEIRVRREREERSPLFPGLTTGGRYIIHANYNFSGQDGEDFQTVRVGRLLNANDALRNLWSEMLAVGEELRSRMVLEGLRKHVVYALDACFASLPPHDGF